MTSSHPKPAPCQWFTRLASVLDLIRLIRQPLVAHHQPPPFEEIKMVRNTYVLI
jgi:hypothetical protein